MHCYRCATPIPENSRFCLSCGALVPEATLESPLPEGAGGEDGDRELEMLLRAETAGEYEVLREIGRGAMGIVFLAREVSLARDVAMKVLPPHLTFGTGAVSRFRREARTAAALEHPNIVPVYRVAPGGRIFWYTMKYLEGRSLADVLKEQGKLPLPASITILERVANALDYAHQRHVIHRDVKPGNVMLETHGHVIVTDFGIAKETATGPLPGSEAIVGTPFYMSPEQCQGGALTGASDQYSLGVMAYQMLTGRLPFDSGSIVHLLQKHVADEPPRLTEFPDHVAMAVRRALSKNPAERFPSVTAFVRALMGPMDDSTIRLPRYWSIRQRVIGGRAPTPVRQNRLRTVAWAGLGVGTAAALWYGTGSLRARVSNPVPAPAAQPATVEQAAATSSSRGTTSPVVAVTRPSRPRTRPALLIVQAVGGWARISLDRGAPHEGTSYRAIVGTGKHGVHLEREGYRPIDTTVVIGGAGGDTTVVRLALQRSP